MSQTTKFNSISDYVKKETNVITYFKAKGGGDVYIFKGYIIYNK